MTKSRTIDVWSQINGGQPFAKSEIPAGVGFKGDRSTEVLRLGESHRDEVFKFCGLRAGQIKWHQRQETDFPGAEHWPYAQAGELYLFFDPEMRWQGLNWEPQPDGESLVTWAARKEDLPPEDDDVLVGRLRLLVNGGGIRHHATLPDFITSLSAGDIDFKLKAMSYDKWLQLTTQASHGTLTAAFTLRSLKARYASRFEIDYCLSSLTLLSPSLARWSA